MPGVALLARANVKVAITADFERAVGLTPAGDWSAAGGIIQSRAASKFEAEQVIASAAVAF
jgi:hypothetical protein